MFHSVHNIFTVLSSSYFFSYYRYFLPALLTVTTSVVGFFKDAISVDLLLVSSLNSLSKLNTDHLVKIHY